MAADVTDLPEGFVLDELPADFTVDPPTPPGQIPGARPGMAAPPAQRTVGPAAPSPKQRAVGAVETALEMLAQATGAPVGAATGAISSLVRMAMGDEAATEENFRGSAKRGAEAGANMVRQATQFSPFAVAARLGGGGQGDQMSPTGREMTEDTGQFLQEQGASLTAMPGGTVLATPVRGVGQGMRATAERAGGAARGPLTRALDAAVPRMDAQTLEKAGKAVDAGIPLRPDMLTGNKFVRMAGEGAENIPLSGGKGNKEKRQAAFNQGLLRAVDPDATDERITPDVFDKAMTKAGEEIGEIAARTPVPRDAIADLEGIIAKDTPDVQNVIRAYAKDLDTMAAENGGVVDGTRLRKLRTEAQTQARGIRGSKGDLAAALDRLVKRIDDAVSEHAADGDVEVLADARRRYAIGTVLEPLVAKSASGDISPAALMARVTATAEGKKRMARGRGGDLGDYARIGQAFLKEQASSGTAERNLVYKTFTDAVAAGKAATMYPLAAAYNLLGPRIAKRMVEVNRRRAAEGKGGPPDPELTAVQLPLSEGRGGGGAPAGPLGDLTPDWETAPGAGAPRVEGVDPTGMVRAVDETDPLPQGIPQRPGAQIPLAEDRPLGDLTPDWETTPGAGGAAMRDAEPGLVPALDDPRVTTGSNRAVQGGQIPAVDGLPGVDDVAVAGPGFVDAAPGARERLAERPRPNAPAPAAPDLPPVVADVVEEVRRKREAAAVKEAGEKQKRADADALRAAALRTTDPELQAALRARADKLDPPEKIPVGETKEGQPPIKTDEPKKPLPVGKTEEVPVEKIEVGDEPVPAGEATELPVETISLDPDEGASPIGRKWASSDGEREIIGMRPDGKLLVTRPGLTGAEIVSPDQLESMVRFDERAAASRKTSQEKAAAQAKAESDAKAEREDTDGFAEQFKPTQRANVITTLQKNIVNNGNLISRRNLVRERVAAGGKIVTREGQRALEVPGDGYLLEKQISKTAMDYAEHLIGKQDSAFDLDNGFPAIDESFMAREQLRQNVSRPPLPQRGIDQVRRSLEEGRDSGALNKDGVSLALWALDKNPNLARDLRVEVSERQKGVPARGAYNSAEQLVKLFTGGSSSQTAVHEILHHSERMMPQAVQTGIRREWQRALDAEMAKASPEVRTALQDAQAAARGDKSAFDRMLVAFKGGVLDKDKHYQLVNPTEFWAVNASRILHDRFTGRGSWRAQAKQWLQEMVEHVKGTVGLRSDAPILKALADVLDAEKNKGASRGGTTMIKDGMKEPPAKTAVPKGSSP